jgi:hypothetical protein
MVAKGARRKFVAASLRWILMLGVLGTGHSETPGLDCEGLPCWEFPECCPDSCPCWTPENGAMRDAGLPDPCGLGYPESGWVSVWDQAPLDGKSPPGCLMWDPLQMGLARLVGALTPAQVAACITDIVALGTATAIANPGVPHGCLGQCFPPDCEMSVLGRRCTNTLGTCEVNGDCDAPGYCGSDLLPCQADEDCLPAGVCAGSFEWCHSSADCPDAAQCEFIMPQACYGTSGICDDWLAFTYQAFDLVSGLGSELSADADYSRAVCHGVQTPIVEDIPVRAIIVDPTTDPPPGDARYFLTRAIEGVSCREHGDSSLVPDPRDSLDAGCP